MRQHVCRDCRSLAPDIVRYEGAHCEQWRACLASATEQAFRRPAGVARALRTILYGRRDGAIEQHEERAGCGSGDCRRRPPSPTR